MHRKGFWSWFSLQCPFECQGGQGGQRWWGSVAAQVCLGAQEGQGIILSMENGHRFPLVHCSCGSHPGPERGFMWVCSSWVMLLSSAFLLDSPRDTRMSIVLGIEKVAKPHSAHPLGAMLGFQTQLSQQEQYSPNAFLEMNAFPHALHSLCQHLCAESCPPRSSVWSCHPSAGCDSHMVCWLCHAGTLPFLGRNYMTIKPRATGTFQVPVSSPLLRCLTLTLRNLSLDSDFLTRKWVWWLHSQALLFDWPSQQTS